MTTSPETNELTKALVTARQKFATVKKDQTAKIESNKGSYAYTYANLVSVLEATTEPLCEAGVFVMQAPHVDDTGALALVTRLSHTSGQWAEARYPLKHFDRAQEMGSAITYARRYALTAMLGIAAEEDDDGAAATAAAQPAKGAGEAWQIYAAITDVKKTQTSKPGVIRHTVTFSDGTKASTISEKLGAACIASKDDGEYVADLIQTQYGTDVKKIVKSAVQSKPAEAPPAPVVIDAKDIPFGCLLPILATFGSYLA